MGPKGPKGAPGAMDHGPLGPHGPMGPFGVNGPHGPLGPHGPNGPLGPHGPHGPMGPMGPMGPWSPVYVAFTQRCWGKGTNEKHPYMYIINVSYHSSIIYRERLVWFRRRMFGTPSFERDRDRSPVSVVLVLQGREQMLHHCVKYTQVDIVQTT